MLFRSPLYRETWLGSTPPVCQCRHRFAVVGIWGGCCSINTPSARGESRLHKHTDIPIYSPTLRIERSTEENIHTPESWENTDWIESPFKITQSKLHCTVIANGNLNSIFSNTNTIILSLYQKLCHFQQSGAAVRLLFLWMNRRSGRIFAPWQSSASNKSNTISS